MIQSIRHRGLKRLFQKGDGSALRAEQLSRLARVLNLLDLATGPQDLDLPGYGFHPLRGDLKGFWLVRITGNFRIDFRMENGDAHDVDLVDYH